MADLTVFDAWVNDAFGANPSDYANAPGAGASAAAADPSSPAGEAGAPPGADPTGLFGRSKDKPQAPDPGATPSGDAGTSPAAKPGKPAKLVLTSETEVTQPGNRARTKLGVGERVTLKLTPVSGDWKVSGAGTINPAKGSTVTLTASGKPGKISVSVTAQGQTKKLSFTVIAPSSVHQDTISTEHYNVGVPNAGFHGQVYCGPATVNFVNITFLEAEIGCKATGSWVSKNGKGHGPNTSPIGFSDTVVAGKGTKSDATDHCWSGYVPGLKLKDWSGVMTFSIPWTYQCNGVTGKIATVVQTTRTAKDGTTSTKKAGGSSGDFALS